MDFIGAHTLVARPDGAVHGAELGTAPLKSGYVDRHKHQWPKALPPASGSPWVLPNDYKLDIKLFSRPGDRADRRFVHFAGGMGANIQRP